MRRDHSETYNKYIRQSLTPERLKSAKDAYKKSLFS